MRTVRRLLYRDIGGAIVFVLAAFLGLFFFIDFVDELDAAARVGQSAGWAALHASLKLPAHAYETLPIAVLIGAIFALSRLAQSSEFTILRTAGLGPGRALSLLAGMGALTGVLTFALGDLAAPWAEQQAQRADVPQEGGAAPRGPGTWLKDRVDTDAGVRSIVLHVREARSDGELRGVRLFEFNDKGQLLSRTEAPRAQVDSDGTWRLLDAERMRWPAPQAGRPALVRESLTQLDWRGTLRPDVLRAALQPPTAMTTMELHRFTRHLAAQHQASQRYDIQFWRKALYPFACLVMAALALPFAYLHARSGGISVKVFGGILLGISYVLLNNVASHVGLLQGWTPWVAAGLPSVLYLGLSMAAFAWLVRYR